MYLILFLFLLIVILLLLSYWYSGTETALVNLNNNDLANIDKTHKNYLYLIKLKENLNRTLITILIMNNIINVLLSSLPVLIISSLFNNFIVGIMIGSITFLIILFGDIIPKSKAILNKRQISLNNSRIIYYNMVFFRPLISFLIMITDFSNYFFNSKKQTNKLSLINNKTIEFVAETSEKSGNIKSIERQFIQNVLQFGDLKVSDIVIPKSKVYFLEKNYFLKDIKKDIKNSGYTRVPVLLNKKIKGVLYAKDLILSDKMKISEILRETFVTSEDIEISDLLETMKLNKVHMAIVMKKNNFIGIVTLEDILESIVGTIKDEYSENKKMM